MIKKFTKAFIVCILLILSACGDDVVVMPAEVCQVTCTDDASGDIYGIALRAMAWNNENDNIGEENDYGCYYYIDAYRGKIKESGEFEEGSKFWSSGLVGPENEFGKDAEAEPYTLDFFDNNFETSYVPLEDYLLYQLLDESTIKITETTTAIAAQYVHNINTCILDSQLSLYLSCDRELEGETSAKCIGPDPAIDPVYCIGCGEAEEIKCPEEASSCTEDINYEDIDESVQNLIKDVE